MYFYICIFAYFRVLMLFILYERIAAYCTYKGCLLSCQINESISSNKFISS